MLELPFDIRLLNGHGETCMFHLREAVPEDIDKVIALQGAIVDSLEDKDILAAYTDEEALEVLTNNCCFIAEAEGGEVAGYSVLILNTRIDEENYGHYLGYDEEQLRKTASLDLTLVAPEYRGYGLQRLFTKIRIAYAIDSGATEALSTVSPDNPYSFRNLEALNLKRHRRMKLYGGKDRFIFRKEL